jgi:hypothetical protein
MCKWFKFEVFPHYKINGVLETSVVFEKDQVCIEQVVATTSTQNELGRFDVCNIHWANSINVL